MKLLIYFALRGIRRAPQSNHFPTNKIPEKSTV